MSIKEIIAGLISPVTDIIKRRQERKAAKESAKQKLAQAAQDAEYKLEFSDQELEALQTKGLNETWKDEYVTVSVVSIFNLIVVGGVASAYGHNEVLEGVATAVKALVAAGVDVGFLLEATIMAAIGLSIWRKA
jgi:tRNA A37 threonylcarbamoyltransferase TsaD